MLSNVVGTTIALGYMAAVLEHLPYSKNRLWPRRLLDAMYAALTFRPLPCEACGRYAENTARDGSGILLFSSDVRDEDDLDSVK
jgi:hypothetical protein